MKKTYTIYDFYKEINSPFPSKNKLSEILKILPNQYFDENLIQKILKLDSKYYFSIPRKKRKKEYLIPEIFIFASSRKLKTIPSSHRTIELFQSIFFTQKLSEFQIKKLINVFPNKFITNTFLCQLKEKNIDVFNRINIKDIYYKNMTNGLLLDFLICSKINNKEEILKLLGKKRFQKLKEFIALHKEGQ